MSTTTIPNENRQTRQLNQGDIYGELWSSFCIDLSSSPGKIKSAKRLTKILDEVDDLGNDEVQDILIYNRKYYALTTGKAYECSVSNDPTDSANWSEDSNVSDTLDFDTTGVVFGGNLLMSDEDDIHELDGSTFDQDWWTGTISGTQLTTDKPHVLHTHKGGAETLFVTDGNVVRYYNTSHSTVTLAPDLTACCIASGVDAVWVGTYTEDGENAYVYEIFVGQTTSNGTAVSNRAYPVKARAILAIEVVGNIPYIVTETGEIQEFNGAGFSAVAYFPFAFSKERLVGVRPGLVQDASRSRPVHPRGMKSHLRSIYILINTQALDTGNKANYRSPSGVWEFDVDTGNLTHRTAFADSATDYGAHVLGESGPLLIADAPETFFLAGAGIKGGNNNGVYAEGTAGLTSFITTEIDSNTIQDAFEKVHQQARTLADGDRIVLKYRTKKNTNYPITVDINWVSATKFTTNDASFANVSIADEGAEIEIQEGYRSGYLAQITNIEGTNTYTVTVDESIGLAGQSSTVTVENFSKIDNEYIDDDGEFKSLGINETNPWAQFKVCMYGDVEYRRFINKTNAKTQM